MLKREYFDSQSLKILFSLINDHIMSYNKEVEQHEALLLVDEYVMRQGLSSEVLNVLTIDVKAVFKTFVQSEQFIIDQLSKYCRRQALKSAISESIDILEKDGCYEQVLKLIDNAISVGSGVDSGLTFDDLKNLPEIYRSKYNPTKLVRTGFYRLDKALEGGFAPGELHIIQAPPKIGKSTVACNIGANALVDGKAVFHISLEISDIDVLAKYGVRLSGYTYAELKSCNPEEYREKLERFEKYKPNLFINYWTELSANVLNLRSWISHQRAKTGVQPGLIIVDYDDPVSGDTKIPLLDGTEIEIKDLVGREEFWLYACKSDGTIVPGRGHSARVAREVTELVEITLDNGETIKSTTNHNHMLRDGTYKKAEDFVVGDSMMPLYRNNHKVSYVRKIKLDTPVPVYCLSVYEYHNYALSAGVFTHNCLVPIRGKQDDLYGDAGEIYSDLKGLADYFAVPVLTFAQPKREAWDKFERGELIVSSDLAHSARKAMRAFSISSLNFKEGEDIGIFYVDRTRRGESGVKIKIRRELSCGLVEEVHD